MKVNKDEDFHAGDLDVDVGRASDATRASCRGG